MGWYFRKRIYTVLSLQLRKLTQLLLSISIFALICCDLNLMIKKVRNYGMFEIENNSCHFLVLILCFFHIGSCACIELVSTVFHFFTISLTLVFYFVCAFFLWDQNNLYNLRLYRLQRDGGGPICSIFIRRFRFSTGGHYRNTYNMTFLFCFYILLIEKRWGCRILV